MNINRAGKLSVTLVLCLFIFGCGLGPAIIPTLTAIPTPSPTLTVTPVSAGTITGRVYWEVSGDPIQSELILCQGPSFENDCVETKLGSTQTDKDGNYSFSVQEAGTYHLRLDTHDFDTICSGTTSAKVSSHSDWPRVFLVIDEGGKLAGAGIVSKDITIEVRHVYTLDCAWICQ